jgi:hypothetical protein
MSLVGAIRLIHCITATTPEEFYQYYPCGKSKKDFGKMDYWRRLLKNDDKEHKEKKRAYMKDYRRRKEQRND